MSQHIKMGDREYVLQEAYEWPLAIYLFFGGLSGALAVTGVVLHFLGLAETLVSISIVSSIISMSLAGIVLVLFELMRPFAAWRSLFNWKHSGISWDVILVSFVIGGGVLFVLPNLFQLGRLTDILLSIQIFTGILTLTAGVLFPIVSGGLLSAFQSVPFWHGPGLPAVMFLTSFNAAFSYLIIAGGNRINETMLRGFWGVIFALTLFLILLILSYIETIKNGPVEAQLGMSILKKNVIFIIGFLLIGLILPAFISGWMFFGTYSSGIAIIGALSVILGGFVLRHYLLKAGVHTYPWPY